MINVDWKRDRVASAEKGENPTVIIRMKSGFAVMGDTQLLPGYCVLLASPKVQSLNDLKYKQRSQFLLDMSLIGEAIESICKPRRVNYSLEGNSDSFLKDPFLHAHIFPRYEWEDITQKNYPVWRYPLGVWSNEELYYCEENYGELKRELSIKIKELMDKAY